MHFGGEHRANQHNGYYSVLCWLADERRGITHQALSALERINGDALNQGGRDADEQVVVAVDELAVTLGGDDETDNAVAVGAPGEWADHKEEWGEKIDEAYEAAEIPRPKGILTTKTIDDREYYYLQWCEGEKLKSQYVAPISPA